MRIFYEAIRYEWYRFIKEKIKSTVKYKINEGNFEKTNEKFD